MTRFVRQAPRMPKRVQVKLESRGIVLKRTREGKMCFTCSYGPRFSTFVVTRRGEQWLNELGFMEGYEIDRHLVQDLHDFGYIEVHESLTPASRRTRSGTATRRHRTVEVPEWLTSVRERERSQT
jgi:hypothetical protein